MILVFVEHAEGGPDRLSVQALTLARQLAAESGALIEAVLIGAGARAAARGLAGQGVATAHVVEDARLDGYAPEAWAATVAQLIAARKPSVVIAAGSERGNEVLAHVAARTDLPMAANCTDVRPGEPFAMTRQRWAGSLLEEARLDASVRLLTVAPHVFEALEPVGPAGSPPAIESFGPQLTERDLRVRVTGRVEAEAGRLSLSDARVVVGGGRGVGSAEAFSDLEELAGLLGGVVGVSRAVTSAGWRPHTEQIGQTGLRIAPELYIACGISGAIQHIVGCKAAKAILAINTDAEAPIMSSATYAVIGNLHEVVPAISAELRRTGGGGRT